jgi:hypothetical protein
MATVVADASPTTRVPLIDRAFVRAWVAACGLHGRAPMSTRRLLAVFSTLAACTAADPAKGEPEALETSAGKFDGAGWVEHGALAFGVDGEGKLGRSTAFHRWTFELGATSDLDLRTAGNGDGAVDTVIYLYRELDGELELVDFDDDGGYGALSRLVGTFDAGRYELVVAGYRRSTKGRFALRTTCTGAGCEGPVPEPDAACLLGASLAAFQADPAFSGIAFSLMFPADVLTTERRAQIEEAGRRVTGQSLSAADVFARADRQEIRYHASERVVSGARYSTIVFDIDGLAQGAIFRGDTIEVVARVQDGVVTDCTLLRAPGGNQLGEDCSADVACGEGLRCTGIPDGGVNGKCGLADALVGEGETCSAMVSCPSDELVCGGLGDDPDAGLCLPVWMRGRFGETEDVFAVPAGGELSRGVVAYGLATVAMEIELYAEIVHPRITQLRVSVVNPSGTRALVWDGAQVAAENPDVDLDEDGFVEIFDRVTGIPGDESANGTWMIEVENADAASAGELTSWSLGITSRWD